MTRPLSRSVARHGEGEDTDLDDEQSPPRTISSLAHACRRDLDSLCHMLPSTQYRELENVAIDELGRFKIWAANLGALQNSQSASSLDSRLRDAERMRMNVLSGIERLSDVVSTAREITTGKLPNRCDIPDPFTEQIVKRTVQRVLEGVKGQPSVNAKQIDSTTELAELFLNIQSSITSLFELSVLIRRDRPRGKTQQHGAHAPLTDPNLDILHARDKFPKLKKIPGLAEKIGAGISRQRDYIRYRQAHRRKLARPGVVVEADGRSIILSAHATTKATSFGEPSVETSLPTEGAVMDVAETKSNISIATSFATTAPGGLSSGRKIPELTDMWLEEVQLDYDTHFECPYCRTIQKMSNRKQWKHHVYQDLELYMCTFPECSTPPFATSHEWFQHEMDNHRRQWKCIMCHTKVGSAPALEAHFKSSPQHAGGIPAAQIPVMVKACETALTTFQETACPFCDEWKPPAAEDSHPGKFKSHLEKHLQELAREALPLAIEGLEIRDSESETLRCAECLGSWDLAEHGRDCPVCGSKDTDVDPFKPIDERDASSNDEDDQDRKSRTVHATTDGHIVVRIGTFNWAKPTREWKCWGPSTSKPCERTFDDLGDLKTHFETAHVDGHHITCFFMGECQGCSAYFDLPGQCSSCDWDTEAVDWILASVPLSVVDKYGFDAIDTEGWLGFKPGSHPRHPTEALEQRVGTGNEAFGCLFPECFAFFDTSDELVEHVGSDHDMALLQSAWRHKHDEMNSRSAFRYSSTHLDRGSAVISPGKWSDESGWLPEDRWVKLPQVLKNAVKFEMQDHDARSEMSTPSPPRSETRRYPPTSSKTAFAKINSRPPPYIEEEEEREEVANRGDLDQFTLIIEEDADASSSSRQFTGPHHPPGSSQDTAQLDFTCDRCQGVYHSSEELQRHRRESCTTDESHVVAPDLSTVWAAANRIEPLSATLTNVDPMGHRVSRAQVLFLDRIFERIWASINEQPEYLMTPDEFLVFEYHKHYVESDPVAQQARERYLARTARPRA